jgi:cytochrome oxidase Cu insertion factor (SCO1/SenC/PrrC family)
MLQPIVVLVVLVAVVLAGCGPAGGDGLAVGDDAPDFALPDSFGSTVSLDDYAGEPALLYFHMADG